MLGGQQPEVYTLNLVWHENPKPTDILRLLVTLPESVKLNQLYECDEGN